MATGGCLAGRLGPVPASPGGTSPRGKGLRVPTSHLPDFSELQFVPTELCALLRAAPGGWRSRRAVRV